MSDSVPPWIQPEPEVWRRKAAQYAKRLLGFFPIGAATDPEIFMVGLTELFGGYDARYVEAVLSPHSGLPAKYKFLPSISEIREALEERAAADRRLEDYQRRFGPDRMLPPPDRDRSNHPTVEELKAKYGEDWGLKDPFKPVRKVIPWDQQVASWDQIKISDELRELIKRGTDSGDQSDEKAR